MERKKSWIRPFIMITLSHAEKRALTPQNVISRITGLFSCSSIVVATEPCWSKTRNFVDISIGIPGVDILIWKMNAQFFAIFPDAKGNGPLSLLT